jgi:hypothetical protein
MIAASLLAAAGKPGTYTAPGGVNVAVRVIMNDAPGETRREAGEEFYNENALAVVPEYVEPEQGGVLTVSGTTYRVMSVIGSRVAGLLDCDVIRLTGPGVDVFNLSSSVIGPLSETILLDGRPVRATVARKADTIDADQDGNEIMVQRNRIAIRHADLGDAERGSIVEFDGDRFLVTSIRRTSAGIINLIC